MPSAVEQEYKNLIHSYETVWFITLLSCMLSGPKLTTLLINHKRFLCIAGGMEDFLYLCTKEDKV